MQELSPERTWLLTQIEHIFFQKSLDAVMHTVDATNTLFGQRGFDGPDQAGINDGGCSA